MVKIDSLEKLKEWNENPVGKPVLLEWALENFFVSLENGKTHYCNELRSEMVKFCMKCEGMSLEDSIKRVDDNFQHYSGYSAEWRELFESYNNKSKSMSKEQDKTK